MRLLLILIFTVITMYANDAVHLSRFYVNDHNRAFQIKEILNTKQDQWHPLDKSDEAFHVTHSRIWVKLLFKNSSKVQQRVIELPNLFRGEISLYDAKGSLIHSYSYDLPFKEMSFFYPNISLPFIIPHGESVFYLTVTSSQELNVKMYMWKEKIFQQHILKMLIFYGIYFGGIILLIFYNAVFYVFSREKVFLYYVIYSLNIVLTMLVVTGFGFMLLWPDTPAINQFTGAIFYLSSLTFGLVFSREFLQTKKFSDKLDKILLYAIYMGVAFTIVNSFTDTQISVKLTTIFNFVSLSLMVTAALYIAIVFKDKNARLILFGWSVLAVGVSIKNLDYLGILDEGFLTYRGAEIGTFLEITFFSLALASRYKDKQIALMKSQSELTKINANLEKIVEQKTQDLIGTNKELHQKVALNEQLFKELTHRVKNNLQVILSFLSLQIKSSSDQALNTMLEESRRRIRAITAVHEHLIAARQFEYISMDAYFKELLEQNSKIFKHLHVKVAIDAHGIALPIETATLIGLIVNEIFSNACKYAYSDIKDPIFHVWMDKETEGTYLLKAGDNGSGIDDTGKDSLGMKIISALVKQLQGEYEIIQENGVMYVIRFKISKKYNV